MEIGNQASQEIELTLWGQINSSQFRRIAVFKAHRVQR